MNDQIIIDFVKSQNGCKFENLYVYLACEIPYAELVQQVLDLVRRKELVEVRYNIKDRHGDCVGVLFPKDTSITIK